MPVNPIITHIQRKRRPNANFSLEFIFDDVRKRLKDLFLFEVLVAARESHGFFNRVINIIQIAIKQGTVNHVTGDIHYVTYLLRKRGTILTILDCGFMAEPNKIKRWIFQWLWLKIPVWRSRYVTTISEASKRDIIRYTSCDPDKVKVIPVAVSEIYKPYPKAFNEIKPVLLQIGTAPNKNIDRLIEAISGLNCTLVIVGNLSVKQSELIDQYKVQCVNKMNLTEAQMYHEYCNADIVTFVSLFEGFGMPIIEANCVERPVITASNSSLPEVAGDAACYVDALSVPDIKAGLERIIQDKAYRVHLIERGKINRLRFSNETIASMYGDIYYKALENL